MNTSQPIEAILFEFRLKNSETPIRAYMHNDFTWKVIWDNENGMCITGYENFISYETKEYHALEWPVVREILSISRVKSVMIQYSDEEHVYEVIHDINKDYIMNKIMIYETSDTITETDNVILVGRLLKTGYECREVDDEKLEELKRFIRFVNDDPGSETELHIAVLSNNVEDDYNKLYKKFLKEEQENEEKEEKELNKKRNRVIKACKDLGLSEDEMEEKLKYMGLT